MQTVTTIGLDTAKSVFQIHGVDAGGHVMVGYGDSALNSIECTVTVFRIHRSKPSSGRRRPDVIRLS